MMNKIRSTIHLNEELDHKTRHAAIDKNITFSDAIAQALESWLKESAQ